MNEENVEVVAGTAIVQASAGPLDHLRALLPVAVEGEEEFFDDSDESTKDEKIISYLQLAQPLSKAVTEGRAAVGDLTLPTGVNFGKWLEFIPLQFKRQALKFNRDTNTLECRSLDGIRGHKYGECAKCPHDYNKWPEGNSKEKAPACTKVLAFPAIIVRSEHYAPGEFDGVVAVQFARTSIGAAKQVITTHDNANRGRPKGHRIPYYRDLYHLGSHSEKFAKGPAQVYDIRFLGKVDIEVMRYLSEVAKQYSSAKFAEPDGSGGFDGGDGSDGGEHGDAGGAAEDLSTSLY